MVRRLLMVAAAVALVMAVALPASAGAVTGKLRGFYTSAVQGDGSINWVYCNQATRIVKPDGSAVESYHCELTEWIEPPTPVGMGPDLGPLVYPEFAQMYDNDSVIFRYFSDFLYLTNNFEVCYAETWSEVVTPSGQVNMKATYPTDRCAP